VQMNGAMPPPPPGRVQPDGGSSGPSERALQELRWLKEPDGGCTDDDLSPAALDGIAAPSFRGREEAAPRATVVGRAAENAGVDADVEFQPKDSDVELQPLSAGPAGVAGRAEERQRTWLYNVWPSRSKFFCRGVLMTGGETELGLTPNCSIPNLCAWTCMLAPCSLYFVRVFPHLIQQGSYAMPIATAMVFLMASGFLLAACCSDPGIIPRREVILATGSAGWMESALGYNPLGLDLGPEVRDARNVPAELAGLGYRWCRTCRIIRPPRASHCPDCDNCVLRYDHHCPFVNNCVGQRNYHFFFGFVTSVLCLAILVLPALFVFLTSNSVMHTRGFEPVFYVLIAYGSLVGIAALLSFLLWVYHVFLITAKRTTKEFRRNIANVNEEPTLCATRGPRLFDPWALVDPRDLIRTDEVPLDEPESLCQRCWPSDD